MSEVIETREVVMKLSLTQMESILHFMNFHEWGVEEIIVKNEWENNEHVVHNSVEPTTSNSIPTNQGGEDDMPGDNNEIGDDAQRNVDVCTFCFCNPCVTHYRQTWLGNGARAHARNSAIRKVKYRKFWTLLSSRSAWQHPRYLAKKTRLLQTFRPHDLGETYTLREIMPECVLEQVRSLYPNPPGKPYMGHTWA